MLLLTILCINSRGFLVYLPIITINLQTMLKDEHLIETFKRTADGILFEAFPFFEGFFHSVLFNPPAVNVSVN